MTPWRPDRSSTVTTHEEAMHVADAMIKSFGPKGLTIVEEVTPEGRRWTVISYATEHEIEQHRKIQNQEGNQP